jgi:hypothetical protein
MQRKNNRSPLKNLGRLVTTAMISTVFGAVPIIMLGVHLHAFSNGPREKAIESLLVLPPDSESLPTALKQLESLGLVKHITWSPPDISGDDGLSVNRWGLTRLGKKVVTQWQEKRAFVQEDLTLIPQVLSMSGQLAPKQEADHSLCLKKDNPSDTLAYIKKESHSQDLTL